MARRDSRSNALRAPQLWIGIAVSVAAMALVLRGIDYRDLWSALSDAEYYLLLPTVVLIVVALYLRALRWLVLLYPLRGLPVIHVFGAINVGYAINNTVPLRAGELARAYVLHRTTGVSGVRAFSTVVVERLFDVLAIAAILLVASPFVEAPVWLTALGGIVGGAALLAIPILASAGRKGSRGRRLAYLAANALPKRWRPGAHGAIDSAAAGLEVTRSWSALLGVSLLTASTWLASALAMYLVLRAFSLSGGFTAALYIAAATTLSTSIPAAPGYLGVFHAAAAAVLTDVFGANHERAVSFALVLHALIYVTPVVIALGYLWRNSGLISALLADLRRLRPATLDEDDGHERPRADPSLPGSDV